MSFWLGCLSVALERYFFVIAVLEASDATLSLRGASSTTDTGHLHSSSSARICASSRVAIASTSYITIIYDFVRDSEGRSQCRW